MNCDPLRVSAMEKVLREGQPLRREDVDKSVVLGRTKENGFRDKSTFQIRKWCIKTWQICSKYSKYLKNAAFYKVQFWGMEVRRCWKPGRLQAYLAVQRKRREAAAATGPLGVRAKAAQEEDRECWIRCPKSSPMGIQTPRNKAWQWTSPAKSSLLPAQVLPRAVTAFGTGDVHRRGSILSPPHNFHTADNSENNSRGNSKDLLKFQRGNLSERAYVNRKNE